MDSSHVPNQIWFAKHVMNPNIKEVIDIPSGIFGDLALWGYIYRCLYISEYSKNEKV